MSQDLGVGSESSASKEVASEKQEAQFVDGIMAAQLMFRIQIGVDIVRPLLNKMLRNAKWNFIAGKSKTGLLIDQRSSTAAADLILISSALPLAQPLLKHDDPLSDYQRQDIRQRISRLDPLRKRSLSRVQLGQAKNIFENMHDRHVQCQDRERMPAQPGQNNGYPLYLLDKPAEADQIICEQDRDHQKHINLRAAHHLSQRPSAEKAGSRIFDLDQCDDQDTGNGIGPHPNLPDRVIEKGVLFTLRRIFFLRKSYRVLRVPFSFSQFPPV